MKQFWYYKFPAEFPAKCISRGQACTSVLDHTAVMLQNSQQMAPCYRPRDGRSPCDVLGVTLAPVPHPPTAQQNIQCMCMNPATLTSISDRTLIHILNSLVISAVIAHMCKCLSVHCLIQKQLVSYIDKPYYNQTTNHTLTLPTQMVLIGDWLRF